MIDTGVAVAAAAIFVWLGMVLAISFIEAPLKFRAPGVTLPIGLGIGRIVFRALNLGEGLLALIALAAFLVAGHPNAHPGTLIAVAVPIALLLSQVLGVRPALARRTRAVLAAHDQLNQQDQSPGPRSHAHLVYVALEVLKVAALLTAGVVLLSA